MDKSIENNRLILALGIVTTSASIFVSQGWQKPQLILGITLSALLFSSLLAGIYLILSAASLKYKDNDSIGNIPFTDKFRAHCYDYAVNVFGYFFILLLVTIIDIKLKEWHLVNSDENQSLYSIALAFFLLVIYICIFYMRRK